MKKIDLKCEHCGNDEEFFIKERYSGTCKEYIRTDGREPDNSEFYDNARHTITSKFVFCAKCGRRVAKIEDVEDFFE